MSHILNTVTQQQNKQGYFIPSRQNLLEETIDLLETENSELLDPINMISCDVGLSAKVLTVMNSGFMGVDRAVFDVKQAAMLLGKDRLRDIVVNHLNYQKRKEASISFERFWDESYLVATVMEAIGDRFKESIPLELLYTIGLFHDIGIAALACNFEDYRINLERVKEGEFASQLTMEEEIYHTNHAIVGYFIANGWHLPKDICKIILLHHDLDMLKGKNGTQEQLCYAILKTADDIVKHSKDFQSSDDWNGIKADVCNILGITELDYLDLRDDIENELIQNVA